jgi:hypothetical protein
MMLDRAADGVEYRLSVLQVLEYVSCQGSETSCHGDRLCSFDGS